MGNKKHIALCECGRPAIAIPKYGKKRSKKARAGCPVFIKGHDLCLCCYQKEIDQYVAKQLAGKIQIKD